MEMTKKAKNTVRIKDAIALLQDCIEKGENVKINAASVSEYSGLSQGTIYNHPLMRSYINRYDTKKKAVLLDSYIAALQDGYFERHENIDDVREAFKNDHADTDSVVLQRAINLLIKNKIIVPHLTQPNTFIKAVQEISAAPALKSPGGIYALVFIKGNAEHVVNESELEALIKSALMKDPTVEIDIYKKTESVKMQLVRQAVECVENAA